MGVGERFYECEQDLIKIWIFLGHYTFGEEKQERLLREEIWNSLENDRWHLYLKFPLDLKKINFLISKLNKKSGKNIINILSDYTAERVENGGSYGLVDKAGNLKITCSLPHYLP